MAAMRSTLQQLNTQIMAIFDDQRLRFVSRGAADAEFEFALDVTRHGEETPSQDDSNTVEFITDSRYWDDAPR
jgi:hypothetical protein